MIRYNADHELHIFTDRDNPQNNWQENHPIGTSNQQRQLAQKNSPIFRCEKCGRTYPAIHVNRDPLPLDELRKRREEWLIAAERDDGTSGRSKREMETSIAYFSGLGRESWDLPSEITFDKGFRCVRKNCDSESPQEVWVKMGGIPCLTPKGSHVAGLSTYDPKETEEIRKEAKELTLKYARDQEEILKRACQLLKTKPLALLSKLKWLVDSIEAHKGEVSKDKSPPSAALAEPKQAKLPPTNSLGHRERCSFVKTGRPGTCNCGHQATMELEATFAKRWDTSYWKG